jgi:hypothetical protein
MPPGSKTCLTCRKGIRKARGCCARCYDRHHRAVVDGRTTWAKLEGRGLATAPQRANI